MRTIPNSDKQIMRYHRRQSGIAFPVLIGVASLLILGAMIVVNMPGKSYQAALPPLSKEQLILQDRLRDHVYTLAGSIGERNLYHYSALERAAQYISETFGSAGYSPTEQQFTVQGKTVKNIEVAIQGVDRPAELVVVGAHYDSVFGSPGANDNGSGVAALLELARLLRKTSLDRSVRFVAFVNEEPPFYYTNAMGSKRYAEQMAARGEKIIGMLSLETIGYYTEEEHSQHYPFPFDLFYPNTGNFIGFVGNLRSRKLVRKAIKSFRAHAKFPSEGVAAPGWVTGIGWSDHWSFWQAGYPAIMVTDTALFRYREYHSAADRPDILDYDSFTRVVDGLARVVVDLCS